MAVMPGVISREARVASRSIIPSQRVPADTQFVRHQLAPHVLAGAVVVVLFHGLVRA
jgi:hypothetical protein